MKLRQYQQEAYDAILKEFETVQRTMIVAATGTGKTVLLSHVVEHFLKKGRVMVMAHRDELIKQACEKLRAITSCVPVVEKADQWSPEEGLHGPPPLIVTSVQTQNAGRMSRFKPREFSLLVVDEFHHACADSYLNVMRYYLANTDCKLLGVTATPDRADGQLLGTVVDSIAHTYDIDDAVNDGYLVPIKPKTVEIDGLDFSKCRTTAGDLNQGDLEAAMIFEEPLHGVAYATIEIACGMEPDTLRAWLDDDNRQQRVTEFMGERLPKKCIVFCVSVKHAERMAEIFNRWIAGSADVVSGKLCDEDRQARLKAFREGRIRFLCNCMIATEGFDEPSIDTVVMARPTKSRSLYAQMLGRGTRPLEEIAHLLGTLENAEERRAMIAQSGKPSMNVLDFVGNCGRHELISTIDIFATTDDTEEVIQRAKELAEEGELTAQEALDKSREEIEQQKREAEQRKKEREERLRRQAMESARQNLVGASTYRATQLNEWDDPPPGILEKHANIFRKAKVPIKDIAHMNDATRGELCRKIVMHWKLGLCSYKQARVLQRAGWTKQELEHMTFDQASANIDTLARNGWKRK